MEEEAGIHGGHVFELDADAHLSDGLDGWDDVDAGSGGDKGEMAVRTAAEDGCAVVGEGACEHLRVLDDLRGIAAVAVAARLTQDNAERGEMVHVQRLMPRVDDGGIHACGEIPFCEDDGTVGAAEGVARGEGDDVSKRHG